MDLDSDVLVIGGGMAGLAAGITSAQVGLDTIVVRKGQGATADSSGAIDLTGYLPGGDTPFMAPIEGLVAFSSLFPFHPYSALGKQSGEEPSNPDHLIQTVGESVDWLKLTLKDSPAEVVGNLTSNMSALTVLGTWKPTCLVQKTMYSDRVGNEDEVLLFAGIRGMPSFNPSAAAKSMTSLVMSTEQGPRKIVHTLLHIPSLFASPNIGAIEVARKLETPEGLSDFTKVFVEQVKTANATLVALPPIMGLRNPASVKTHLENESGAEVFELLSFPPSVPGYRLQRSLEIALKRAGGRLLVGHEARGFEIEGTKISEIQLASPRRSIRAKSKSVVLATGKFIGGGIKGDSTGFSEPLFGLPVLDGDRISTQSIKPQQLTNQIAISNKGHGLFECGLGFDVDFHPLDLKGEPFASNLFAAGGILGGYNYPVEKSGLGVALTTGRASGKRASTHAKEVAQ